MTGGNFTRQASGIWFSLAGNDDIAGEIESGISDFALYGSDKFDELEPATSLVFEPIKALNCQFALLKRDGESLASEISVATSYPKQLAKFAFQSELDVAKVIKASGKIERFPASFLTDAAFDIVETSDTAAANNLEVCLRGAKIWLGGLWKKAAQDE